MLKKILNLSKKLISIKSTPGNIEMLNSALKICKSNLKEFTIEEFNKQGVKSLLVYNNLKRPKKFKIILNGHLDVIPGKNSQYKPKIIGNKLYGIGSMDMKSNLACLVTVFKETAKKVNYPIALQLVTDEETGGLFGTKYQIEKGVRADFVIAGETTNFDIVDKTKGVIWLKIFSEGKTSHSAYPWQGKNSIWEINEFLNKLKKIYSNSNKETQKTTVNLSRIETSNNSFNKVPDDCTIWLDIRYIFKEENIILSKIKKLLPKGFNFEVIHEESPLFVSKNNKYLKLLKKAADETLKYKIRLYQANGTSDLTHFSKVGCPGVEFGPIGLTGNTNNEYINIPSLKTYYQILTKFLINLN